MLDNFIFENHLGMRFVGLENGVYLNYSDLRNYSWDYDTINNRISRFYRPIKDRKIPLIVCCKSDEEAIEIKNRLFELAEMDVAAKLPGKIYIGDYYTTGYITASTKGEYLLSKRMCKIDLTLTSDDPAWYREDTYIFPINGEFDEEEEPGGEPEGVPIIPEGTLKITENGTFNIAKYAAVEIDVAVKLAATDDDAGHVTLHFVAATSDGEGNITFL